MEHMEDTLKALNPIALFFHNLPQSSTALNKKGKRMTPTEYASNVAARFGGQMPSWPELAKRENAARWQRNPISSMARPQVSQDHPNTQAAIEAILAKGEATRASIVAVLTAPMTCPDVANALKRSPQLVRRHLSLLAEQGRVIGRNVKGVTVWERKLEAAE